MHYDREGTAQCVATMLVFDVVGSSERIASDDPETAQMFLDPIVETAQRVLSAHGGTLLNVSGDGGVAIFGYPEGMERHPDNACAAALALHREVVGVALRVGVHSGLVGLRRIRLDFGERLDTTGPVTHLAATLEKAAGPGETLVSSNTLQLCAHYAAVAPAETPRALRARGATAYRLKRLNPARDLGARSPMIGRARESADLERRLRLTGGAVVVLGEPGLGKSRLMAATESALASEFDLVLKHQVRDGDRTVAFAAAAALLDRLAEADGAPSSAPSVRDGVSAKSLGRAFGEAVGERRALVVIDDLHLIDEESLAFLAYLAPRGRLALLACARTEGRAAAGRLDAWILDLEPLGVRAIRDLARQLSRPGEFGDETTDAIVRRSGGVPFILEQLLFSLRVDKTRPDALLPQSVESLIHSRLASLPASARRLAQALAIAAEDIPRSGLAALLGRDEAEVAADLEALERIGVLSPEEGAHCAFRHAIVAAASATTLPGPARKDLHRLVMKALAADETAPPRFARLGHHAEAAGEDAAAVEYYWRAAREMRLSAAGSLVALFERALACMERLQPGADDRYVDFVMASFASLVQLGELDLARSHLPRLMRRARDEGREDRIAGALCQIGILDWFAAEFEEGVAHSEEALAIADRLGSPPLAFSARFNMATALTGLGRVREALALLNRMRRELAAVGPDQRLGAVADPMALVESYLGWIYVEADDLEAAKASVAQGLERARAKDNLYGLALALCSDGRLKLFLGDHQGAVAALSELRGLCIRNSFDAIRPNGSGLLMQALARAGLAEAAAEEAADCDPARFGPRTGATERVIMTLGAAEAAWANGETELARERAAQGLADARASRAPIWISRALGVAGAFAPAAERASLAAEREALIGAYGLTRRF